MNGLKKKITEAKKALKRVKHPSMIKTETLATRNPGNLLYLISGTHKKVLKVHKVVK